MLIPDQIALDITCIHPLYERDSSTRAERIKTSKYTEWSVITSIPCIPCVMTNFASHHDAFVELILRTTKACSARSFTRLASNSTQIGLISSIADHVTLLRARHQLRSHINVDEI